MMIVNSLMVTGLCLIALNITKHGYYRLAAAVAFWATTIVAEIVLGVVNQDALVYVRWLTIAAVAWVCVEVLLVKFRPKQSPTKA